MTDCCNAHDDAVGKLMVDNFPCGVEQICAVMESIGLLPDQAPNIAGPRECLFEFQVRAGLFCEGLACASESITMELLWAAAKSMVDLDQPARKAARLAWIAEIPFKIKLLSNTVISPSIAVDSHQVERGSDLAKDIRTAIHRNLYILEFLQLAVQLCLKVLAN